MKKYRVIIDMTKNFLAFWLGHCTHIKATFPNKLGQPRLPAETVDVRIEKDITPQNIIKRGLKKNMTNFLQTPNKFSSKKKR